MYFHGHWICKLSKLSMHLKGTILVNTLTFLTSYNFDADLGAVIIMLYLLGTIDQYKFVSRLQRVWYVAN